MPLQTCPCRLATPVWAGRIGDEAPSSAKLRPTHSACSMCCDTHVDGRTDIRDNNLIRASDVRGAKLIVEVSSGYF